MGERRGRRDVAPCSLVEFTRGGDGMSHSTRFYCYNHQDVIKSPYSDEFLQRNIGFVGSWADQAFFVVVLGHGDDFRGCTDPSWNPLPTPPDWPKGAFRYTTRDPFSGRFPDHRTRLDGKGVCHVRCACQFMCHFRGGKKLTIC